MRRPGVALGACVLVIAVLSVLGIGVSERLHFRSFEVDGTSSQRAEELSRARFGDSVPLVVLLQGPRADAERQGHVLARGIEAKVDADVIGPWSPGTGAGLRPDEASTLLVIRVNEPFEETAREAVPLIRAEMGAAVSEPVMASLTGQADIYEGLHEASLDSLHRAELIVAPFLLLILLIVFRSPIAALLPLGIGVATIGVAGGVLSLLADPLGLDVVALNTVSMVGLALAVDYSLLIVSRYREELRTGATPEAAVMEARRKAGHTVLFAGLVLSAVMVVAYAIAAGDLLRSAAGGVLLATLLSMAGALLVLPPALLVLGGRIEAWQLGGGGGAGLWSALAARVLNRPGIAVLLAAIPLLVAAGPALGLDSGPPTARDLPESRPERQDYERLTAAIGSGWAFPYEVTIASNDGPITERESLRRVSAWQADLVDAQGVEAVFGPGAIRSRTRGIDSLPATLARLAAGFGDGAELSGQLDDFLAGAESLGRRLESASAGAADVTAGVGAGAQGAADLAAGAADARGGLGDLAGALAAGGELGANAGEAAGAAREVLAGLNRAAARLGDSLPQTSKLADGLRSGVDDFRTLRRYAERTEDRLAEARDALEAMLPTSQADPQYNPALNGVKRALQAVTGRDPDTGAFVRPPYFGLPASLAIATDQLARGAKVGERLQRKAHDLRDGLTALAGGQEQLAAGLDNLRPALGRLASGVAAIDSGIERLGAGAESLRVGLDEIGRNSSPLGPGLGTIAMSLQDGNPELSAAVGDAQDLADEAGSLAGRSDSARLDSGYLTLAAVDSAPSRTRKVSTFSLNVDHGGSAARIYVIGDYEAGGDNSATRDDLEGRANALAAESGDEVEVGGPGAVIADFDRVSAERLALLIALSILIAYLLLIPFLGSALLPAVAVGLNLLTVASTFGILTLCFEGDSPLLGGPGFIDSISLSAVFVVVFGLSIDYQVFLLGRMREEFAITGDPEQAIAAGIRTTAGVVTGAAAVMVAVFTAFALSDIANIRQLGFGLAIAIAIDATLVRLVLLPALVRMMGRRAWPAA